MDARRFDVLHDADDAHHLAVADGIALRFDGAIEEVIDEDAVVGHVAQDVEHLVHQLLLVDHDLHLLPAEHVAGAHQQREAELAAEAHGFLGVVHAQRRRDTGCRGRAGAM